MDQRSSRFVRTMPVGIAVQLSGSGQGTPTPVSPFHVPVPSPDVKIVELHFPYRSISIGGGGWAGRGIERSPRSATREAPLYVGQSDTPPVDFWFAGRFPNLGARIRRTGEPLWR